MDRISFEAISVLRSRPFDFMRWLDEQRFIDIKDKFCPRCDGAMRLQKSQAHADEVCLHCSKRECNTGRTVRTGTFFESYHLPIHVILRVIVCHGVQLERIQCARILDISRGTVAKIYDEIDSLITANVLRYRVKFHRQGTYQMDETYIKYVLQDDGVTHANVWVGGILHPDTGRVVLFELPDRGGPTLNAKIEEFIPDDSILFTDAWPGYSDVPARYHHFSVNHSAGEYVREEDHPTLGHLTVTTNDLEGFWCKLKSGIANRHDRSMKRLRQLMNNFMFLSTERKVLDLIKLKT